MNNYKSKFIKKLEKCEHLELQSIKNRCKDLLNPDRYIDMPARWGPEYSLVTVRIYNKVEIDFDLVDGDN